MRKQYTHQGWAILNAYGDLWTPENFTTERAAYAHIVSCEKTHGWDLSKHTVVPAKITVKIKRD